MSFRAFLSDAVGGIFVAAAVKRERAETSQDVL